MKRGPIIVLLSAALLSPGPAEYNGSAVQTVASSVFPTPLPSVPAEDTKGTPSPKLAEIERLIDAGRLREAQDRLANEISAHGDNYKTLYLEAKILFKERRFPDSLRTLQRSLALQHGDPDVYRLVASNAILLNRLDIAEPSLRSVIQLAPNDFAARFQLGMLYYVDNRFADAGAELRQVTGLNPTFMKAHDILGLALEELGEEKAAIDSYRKAIELTERQNLKDESAYVHLAKFLSRKNRDRECMPLLRKAVDLNPQSAEAHYLLGKTLGRLGDDVQAVAALQRSISSDPRFPDPHYLLSRIHLKQGRKDHAEKEMQTYRELKKVQGKKDDGRRHRPQE